MLLIFNLEHWIIEWKQAVTPNKAAGWIIFPKDVKLYG